MKKELISGGCILCDGLTSEELIQSLGRHIFPRKKIYDLSKLEVHFGRELFNRLCNDDIINYDSINHSFTVTVCEIPCRLSYECPSYGYCVYLKHDHEDQMDSMIGLFQDDIKRQLNAAFGRSSVPIDISGRIKKVIFNPPATIIFWKDGSKTVVKCNGEAFDPEKGMAMAISRKVLGDSYGYYNIFEKWCKKYKEPKSMPTPQEVAAKYMTPPTVSDFNEELQMAAEEVKRYMNIKSGDSDAD